MANEIEIPARGYTSFELKKGRIMKIIEVQGPQVADVNAFNLHNLKEKMQCALTAQLESSYQKVRRIYTNSAQINTIFTVVDDPVGVHFLSGSVGCTGRQYELWFGMKNHTNCFDNLAMAIKPWGLGHEDVHGPFDAFMHVRYDEDGRMMILPPKSKKGDSVSLRAEMDALVAISACPSDTSDCNGADRTPRPLRIEVH